MEYRRRRQRRRWPLLLIVLVAAALGAVWLVRALHVGPPASVELSTDRPAIGVATEVTARFGLSEPGDWARLEIVQAENTALLGEQSFGAAPRFFGRRPPANATITAPVGRGNPEWLKEGEAILRATAARGAGPLRNPDPTIVERSITVRFRPPRLEVVSSQHYVRQGGSGVVVIRVGDTAARSGVRTGSIDQLSSEFPGRGAGERFVLFGIPWDLDDPSQIRVFAEDDAGNRAEQPFLTIFKKVPPRRDRIDLSDAFLEKVVPEIESQTPGLDSSGSLIDRYLSINSNLRRENLATLSALSEQSAPRFSWSGAFLQMENSARRAGFAEVRDYRYQGRSVDTQTHLGLDLASLARAPVPAPNSGTVAFAGYFGIYGNAVVIDHGFGLMSLCGHLSSIDVEKGEEVQKGQPIGRSGATGLAGGDHLHLELLVHGVSVEPVEWLDEHWIEDNVARQLAGVVR